MKPIFTWISAKQAACIPHHAYVPLACDLEDMQILLRESPSSSLALERFRPSQPHRYKTFAVFHPDASQRQSIRSGVSLVCIVHSRVPMITGSIQQGICPDEHPIRWDNSTCFRPLCATSLFSIILPALLRRLKEIAYGPY
jgi:hypothetical protein